MSIRQKLQTSVKYEDKLNDLKTECIEQSFGIVL